MRQQEDMKAPDGRPPDQLPAWRHDFPIDWPEDHYVARRDFTRFLVLTSLAFAVGQLWIGLLNFFRRRRGQPAIMRIARLEDVPVGGSLRFEYPEAGEPCVLVRPAKTTLVAYSQKCTHLSCAVIPRVRDGVLLCPCHEGSFDLATGRALAGPPRRPLPVIQLELRGADVYAVGLELRTV